MKGLNQTKGWCLSLILAFLMIGCADEKGKKTIVEESSPYAGFWMMDMAPTVAEIKRCGIKGKGRNKVTRKHRKRCQKHPKAGVLSTGLYVSASGEIFPYALGQNREQVLQSRSIGFISTDEVNLQGGGRGHYSSLSRLLKHIGSEPLVGQTIYKPTRVDRDRLLWEGVSTVHPQIPSYDIYADVYEKRVQFVQMTQTMVDKAFQLTQLYWQQGDRGAWYSIPPKNAEIVSDTDSKWYTVQEGFPKEAPRVESSPSSSGYGYTVQEGRGEYEMDYRGQTDTFNSHHGYDGQVVQPQYQFCFETGDGDGYLCEAVSENGSWI